MEPTVLSLTQKIVFTVVTSVSVIAIAQMIMDWYERKIDYYGFRDAMEYLNETDKLFRHGINEIKHANFLVALRNSLQNNNISGEYLTDLIDKVTSRTEKIFAVAADRHMQYEQIFPQFNP